MRIPQDFVFLEIEKEHEDSISVAGLDLQLDTSFNEAEHRRIYGIVIAVPDKLSSTPIMPKTMGFPEPRAYVSGETIAYHAHRGLMKSSLPKYYCSTYTVEKIYLNDHVLDVLTGDKVYFNYMALEEEARMGSYFQDRKVYQIRYDNLLCRVRNGQIMPLNGKVFVVPVMQTWEEITSNSGIIMQSDVKPRYLEGIITHIGEPVGGEYIDCKVGDKIFYHPNADWTNKIEGKEYYVIDQSDVLCVVG
jgi:co-chaperonin GroES (HSP10)